VTFPPGNAAKDELGPANAAFLAARYERWLEAPEAVALDEATLRLFDAWRDGGHGEAAPLRGSELGPGPALGEGAWRRIAGVVAWAHAIRVHGHLAARLDPLGRSPIGDPNLEPEAHGVTAEDARDMPASIVGGHCASGAVNALEAIEQLKACYAGAIGHDYGHVRVPEERAWLVEAAESGRFGPDEQPIDSSALLGRLAEVEGFERFLHRVFPGRHRFSIEGLDVLVPMLDALVHHAGRDGAENVVLAMAHRGRLSVLVHVLGREPAEVLAELKDPMRAWKVGARSDLGWSGDVKYHHGALRAADISGDEEPDLHITLLPNSSHLEFVDPVAQGMARTMMELPETRGIPRIDPRLCLPVTIHGDASFPGQGVVAETFNLSRLPGYTVGGTLHLLANNQIGFTTLPDETRSTLFASDLARGFRTPILHVNADEPEACIEALRIAYAYRRRFGKDVLLDVIGYRRHGHNEGDEPRFTQVAMYRRIDDLPAVRERYGQRLAERGDGPEDAGRSLVERRVSELQDVYAGLDTELDAGRPIREPPPVPEPYATGVALETLVALEAELLTVPEEFEVHPKLAKLRERRRGVLEARNEAGITWSHAEELAFASLLFDGRPVRLTGEDTERGTFNQRHAALYDVSTGRRFAPLEALPSARATFEVHNSPLSELAAVGFEHGYDLGNPGTLVVWEAQYGDFINGAQVILDAFVVSGRAKWGQTPSLVFLLPHGHEGQGPDHSTAHPERILQAAADNNLRLCAPTTAGGYFHLLRDQARRSGAEAMPLFVLTPKGLLRSAALAAKPGDLVRGRWRPVISERLTEARRRDIKRVVLCSGKLAVELEESSEPAAGSDVSIVRVEQLYPFPYDALERFVERLEALEDMVWAQEEPSNMGAWDFVRPALRSLCAGRAELRYIGRPRSASPAEGITAWHARNQADLVRLTLDRSAERSSGGIVIVDCARAERLR